MEGKEKRYERKGTVEDCALLKFALENLKFEVHVFKDLSLDQIQKKLEKCKTI